MLKRISALRSGMSRARIIPGQYLNLDLPLPTATGTIDAWVCGVLFPIALRESYTASRALK